MSIAKHELFKLLADVLASYSKPLPEPSILTAWWSVLQTYHLHIVKAAFSDYRDNNGEFAPVPAGIAMRCKTMDGRPGVEEAWAVALTSRDESDTVVWTADIAEAFSLCRPVLDMGDEVGARMAFKESYGRIVSRARNERRPAQWIASLGWDLRLRESALQKATTAGLLSAPVAAALLPPPVGTISNDSSAQGQITKIKQMMVEMNAEKAREGELHSQRERNATDDAKARANEMISNYKVETTQKCNTKARNIAPRCANKI
jgi:hypothetical protein